MNIKNTQTPHTQPSIESLVGNQKQEYPKPSVPPEEPDYTRIKDETNKSENKQNDTGIPRDLTTNPNEISNKDTLKIQEDVKAENIKAAKQNEIYSTKDLSKLHDIINKQKGIQTYIENMGLKGILS